MCLGVEPGDSLLLSCPSNHVCAGRGKAWNDWKSIRNSRGTAPEGEVKPIALAMPKFVYCCLASARALFSAGFVFLNSSFALSNTGVRSAHVRIRRMGRYKNHRAAHGLCREEIEEFLKQLTTLRNFQKTNKRMGRGRKGKAERKVSCHVNQSLSPALQPSLRTSNSPA